MTRSLSIASHTRSSVRIDGPVSVTDPVAIKFADSTSIDPFGRLRVSQPTTLLDTKLHTGISALRWSQVTGSGGAVTADPATASAFLTTVATPGSVALLQSKQRGIYQPLKGLLAAVTSVIGAPEAGVRKEIGMADPQDGIMLRQDTDGLLYIVIRRGGADFEVVEQSNWNQDTASWLDISKNIIFWADLEWLGVGQVRTGVVVGGLYRELHRFQHANVTVGPYINNPNLPIFYQISSTSGAAGSLRAICATIVSEGGVDDLGRLGSFNVGVTPRTIGATRTELLALRLQSAYLRKAMFAPVSVSVYQSNAAFLWEVIINPVGPAGGSWSALGDTFLESNVGRTGTVTSGYILASGYVSTAIDETTVDLATVIAAAADVAGSADVVSLVVTNLSGVARDYYGSLTFREFA